MAISLNITEDETVISLTVDEGVGPRGAQGPDPTTEGVVTRGAILSINADPTKFDVAAGSGYLDGTLITWDAQSAITCTNLATATRTYVSISSAGAVVQSTSKPTPESRRANLFIGQLGHTSNTAIATALTVPDTSVDTNLSLNDLLRCLGPIPCDGNRVSANGSNLSINIDAGYLLGAGANHEDADGTSGVEKYFAALTAPTFRHRTSTGEGSSSSTLDVGFYDNGGTRTAVSGTRAQNFRVYRLLSGNIVIQYGPTTYTSIANAINGFADETFTPFGNITEIGSLIGAIAVKSNATDLSDTSQAQFYTPTALGRASSAAQLNETNLASVFTGATSKTTPIDADEIPLVDSAASYGLKKLTWANLKATAKAYFDTIYAALVHTHTLSDVTDAGTAAAANLGSNNGEVPQWTSAPIVSDRVLTSAGGDITSRTFAQLATDLSLGTLATQSSVDAEDIDFAGSTDIGADLADADEILVSDGGGNTTRRKSAISRLWAYIASKLDGNITIAGTKSFSGQVELTSQSATNSTSAMTRALGHVEYSTRPDVVLTGRMLAADGSTQLWQGTVTGSGAIQNSSTLLQTNTGSTAGSTSHLRLDATNTLLFGKDGSNSLGWNFDAKWIFSFRADIFNAAANTDGYFVLGLAITTTTTTQPAIKSCGFRFHDQGVYGFVHDGSTYTESSSSLLTLSSTNQVNRYEIYNDDTNIHFYINGTLADSITAPTGSTGNQKQGVTFWVDNETTTNDVGIRIHGAMRFSHVR